MSEGKRLLVTVALVLVVVLAELAGVYFLLKEAGGILITPEESLTAEIARLETDIRTERARAEEIPVRREEEAELHPQLEKARQLLPRQSPTDTLVRYIRQKAHEAEVEVILIRPSRVGADAGATPAFFGPQNAREEAPAGPKFQEWNYKIELRGSYDAIATFINLMEEFKIRTPTGQTTGRFFAVKSLLLTVPDNGLKPGLQLNCEVVMRTFRYTGEPLEENV